jgi:hypothetical protein
MDKDTVSDRAQPASDPEPAMAGRIARPGSDRGGGDVSTAGCRAPCSRRASKERSSRKEARGGATASRGSTQGQYKRKRQSDQGPWCSRIVFHHWRIRRGWRTNRARVNRWPSWERHRQRAAAREGEGYDMRRPLNATSHNAIAYELRLRYPESTLLFVQGGPRTLI